MEQPTFDVYNILYKYTAIWIEEQFHLLKCWLCQGTDLWNTNSEYCMEIIFKVDILFIGNIWHAWRNLTSVIWTYKT